jgi:hypothetical protein
MKMASYNDKVIERNEPKNDTDIAKGDDWELRLTMIEHRMDSIATLAQNMGMIQFSQNVLATEITKLKSIVEFSDGQGVSNEIHDLRSEDARLRGEIKRSRAQLYKKLMYFSEDESEEDAEDVAEAPPPADWAKIDTMIKEEVEIAVQIKTDRDNNMLKLKKAEVEKELSIFVDNFKSDQLEKKLFEICQDYIKDKIPKMVEDHMKLLGLGVDDNGDGGRKATVEKEVTMNLDHNANESTKKLSPSAVPFFSPPYSRSLQDRYQTMTMYPPPDHPNPTMQQYQSDIMYPPRDPDSDDSNSDTTDISYPRGFMPKQPLGAVPNLPPVVAQAAYQNPPPGFFGTKVYPGSMIRKPRPPPLRRPFIQK